MTREGLILFAFVLIRDLFESSAPLIQDFAEVIADTCPNAFILVITNPVNSMVPLLAEVLKTKGVFNPNKLFGITTLDAVRASTFTADVVPGISPTDIVIPVVGGHSNKTIVPLLSQASPPIKLDQTKIELLTNRIRQGGDEVIDAKNGGGSATLCMAYAGYRYHHKMII